MPAETKFTPGPWQVVDAVEEWGSSPRDYPFAIMAPSEDIVADVLAYNGEANAYLLASAPELYEALERLTTRYVELVGSGDCGSWNPEEEAEVVKAREVLKKARGEQ